ncbi:hypothetical protein Taro_033053, partial [Colocasia esculenta]|nr:hypothetical protein [Colocasia esculenta]
MIFLDSLIILEPLKAEPTIRRFVKELYHTQDKLASSRSIGSILLLLLKMTTTWFSYSEIDALEHKIENFADLSLNDSPVMPCENEELEDESDSTMKRKYDIPNEDLHRSWVMKDLSFKWKFHKYDLRRKYLKQDKKGIQIKPTSRYHINEDMWREGVKVWTSSAFKRRSEINTKNKNVQTVFHCAGTRSVADIRQVEKEKTGTDLDRADVFIITHTRKDGRPINEDSAIAIEKLKALKQTQPSTNSSNLVVAKDDAFSKHMASRGRRGGVPAREGEQRREEQAPPPQGPVLPPPLPVDYGVFMQGLVLAMQT